MPDILAILIATNDGIPLVRAESSTAARKLGITPEMETMFALYFSQAADQASNMGLGAVQSATDLYKNNVLVHVNLHPIVVTCVHDRDANVGTTLDMMPELRQALEPVRQEVEAVMERAVWR